MPGEVRMTSNGQKLTQGRRVATFDDLERPGDYCGPIMVDVDGVQVPHVYYLLPIHEGETKFDRPTEGSGVHGASQPPWRFTEQPDGSLEIRESIAAGGDANAKPPVPPYWHGYLDAGHIWRELPS